MKIIKIISQILLIIFLSSALVWAGAVCKGKKKEEAAGCTVDNDQEIDASPYQDTGGGQFTITDSQHMAVKLQVGSASDITQYLMRLVDDATSGTFYAQLYGHDSGNDTPDGASPVSGAQFSIDVNSLPGTMADYEATLAALLEGLASGTYWLVAKTSSLVGTGVGWERDLTATGERICRDTDGDNDWTDAETTCWDNYSLLTKLMGCPN